MHNSHKLQQDKRTGIYFTRIQVNGKRTKYGLGKNIRKARRLLKTMEDGQRAAGATPGVTVAADGMTLETLIPKHLEWVEANRSAGTLNLRKRYCFLFYRFMGDVNVADITRTKLEAFYVYAKENAKSHGPNAGNQAMRHVKTLLKWAEEMELCNLPFKRFPVIQHTPPHTKRIAENDLRKLLDCQDQDVVDFVLFGILTGLRPLELRTLKRDQIRHMGDGQAYVEIEHHKTSKTARSIKARSVPLPAQAIMILDRQLKTHPGSDYVFVNDVGTPYTREALRNRIVRASRRAGCSTDVTPYALRHTFASLQAESGIETTSLSQILGHSSNRTVERYVSNTFEHHRKAVGKVEARVMDIMNAPIAGSGK